MPLFVSSSSSISSSFMLSTASPFPVLLHSMVLYPFKLFCCLIFPTALLSITLFPFPGPLSPSSSSTGTGGWVCLPHVTTAFVAALGCVWQVPETKPSYFCRNCWNCRGHAVSCNALVLPGPVGAAAAWALLIWSGCLTEINLLLQLACGYPKGCGHMSPIMGWLLGLFAAFPAPAVLGNSSGVLKRAWWWLPSPLAGDSCASSCFFCHLLFSGHPHCREINQIFLISSFAYGWLSLHSCWIWC